MKWHVLIDYEDFDVFNSDKLAAAMQDYIDNGETDKARILYEDSQGHVFNTFKEAKAYVLEVLSYELMTAKHRYAEAKRLKEKKRGKK